MKASSDTAQPKALTRESIIGLGEASFRKNYYSELQKKLIELECSNARSQALIASIPDILMVSTPDGQIAILNKPASENSAFAAAILDDPAIRGRLQEAVSAVWQGEDFLTDDLTMTYMDSVYYLETRIHRCGNDEVLIIIRDMTSQRLAESTLRDLAEKDSLTGLYNRRYFMEQLERYHGNPARQLTIILIDIDGLKLINDTLGHLAGDEIIIAVSRILLDHFGKIGCAARIGGDEFGILLSGYPQEEVQEKLDQTMSHIDAYNETSLTLKISISSGYSIHQEGGLDTRQLFQEADHYLYQNKLLKESSVRNSLVKTLMKALEAKDFITEGHADRMEELAVKMGCALRLPQHQMDRVKLLAKFHDIGKVGIPDAILFKKAPLNEEEWKIMKTHCMIGKRIARESPELADIAELILLHHEKWDGTGYPFGLKGDHIPIECRIISIADAFDAMTSDRPYHQALSAGEACRLIRESAGSQFDQTLADLFFTLV